MPIEFQTDLFPSDDALQGLWLGAWGETTRRDFSKILSRSLAHVGAYADDVLVGFVNVACDCGIHAFILDKSVDPAWRRQGIASRLVCRACGFRPTSAGLIDLASSPGASHFAVSANI